VQESGGEGEKVSSQTVRSVGSYGVSFVASGLAPDVVFADCVAFVASGLTVSLL